MSTGGAKKCPACGKSVYFNEQVIFAQNMWHKACLKCTTCGKLLSLDKTLEHDAKPYCKHDYDAAFSLKGYSTYGTTVAQPGSTALQSTGVVDAMVAATGTGVGQPRQAELFKTGCPKCGKAVYMAERTRALEKDWHKLCFRCWECSALLHAGSFGEHDGFPFCKKCYDKLYGSEGYGRSGHRNVFADAQAVDASNTGAPAEPAAPAESQ
eukprot:m51a1_g9433 putative cysteine-rich protein 2 (210) ;mRNA; r:434416-435324